MMHEDNGSHAARVRICAEETGRLGKASYARALRWMGAAIQARSEGATVTDTSGRSYIDILDSYGNQTFGFRHPELLAAATEELAAGVLHNCKLFFNERNVAFNRQLAALTNGRLPHAFLSNGGAEAIDTALKLARGLTGRPNFVSARRSYHGMTFAAMSSSHRPDFEALYAPMCLPFAAVDYGDVEQLEAAVDGSTAAVLLETVQAEGGVVVPSAEYLQKAREICDRAGALLILDEIQTAFGRTGRFFAFEHFGVLPDIVCIGKSLGGGFLPISAALCSPGCWQVMQKAPFSFASSMAGAPLALAVAERAIAIGQSTAWLDEVAEKSSVVAGALAELQTAFPDLIVQTEGIGLLWGVGLRSAPAAGLLCWLLCRKGVLTSFSLFSPSVIRVQPPLVIDAEQLQRVFAAFHEALMEMRDFLNRHPESGPLSSMTASTEFDLPSERLFAALTEAATSHALLGAVAGQGSYEPDVKWRVLWDEVLLEWTDAFAVDRANRRIVQRSIAGDWQRFERVWSVRDHGGKAVLECALEWDAGCGELEPMIALRIKHALERAVINVFESVISLADRDGEERRND